MKLAMPALAGMIILFVSCGTVDNTRRYPNMVADADPISMGTIEVQFDRLLSSKLNKAEVEVIFYPRLNAVVLEFRYELIRYRQFWDLLARQQFITALEFYKVDYAERKLSNQYRKTRSAYGRVKGRAEWETFRFSKTYVSYPLIEIGYRFRENSPFFTTLMRSAKAEEDPSDSSQDMSSQQINMYFTRAQADELAQFFDQPYLMGLLGKKTEVVDQETLIIEDSYTEWEDY